jgi:hypothetical protein
MHNGYPALKRRVSVPKGPFLAVDEDSAVVGLENASHDSHQRALARPVFSQKRVDVARTRFEAHVVQGECASEPLRNALETKRRGGAAIRRLPSRVALTGPGGAILRCHTSQWWVTVTRATALSGIAGGRCFSSCLLRRCRRLVITPGSYAFGH